LGTSFNVKAYCDERQQITVATGLVGVEILSQDSRQQYRLRPSDRLTFNPDTKTVTRQQVNMDNLPAWKGNQLVFDRQPLWEVAKTLERKYGVSIRIPEAETAGRLFSGTFAGKDLPHILWALEYSMNVRVERPDATQIILIN
jgi:ferric-dicitrate binding protein FerR (iron transport regulator)